MQIKTLVAFACFTLLAGCQLGSSSTRLTSEGGTLKLGSALTLEVPQGALNDDTVIAVTELPSRENEREFEFEPHHLKLNSAALLTIEGSSEMELSLDDVALEDQRHEGKHIRGHLQQLGRIKLRHSHQDDAAKQSKVSSDVERGGKGSDDNGAGGGTGGGAEACWDGTTLPRPALDPTPSASVAAKFEAWKTAMAEYQAQAATYNQAAKEHADAYAAAAGPVAGKSCHSDGECATGSTVFVGFCRIYYQVGQCEVRDTNPIGEGPVAPAQPDLSCLDFSCSDASYQCEQEASTAGIACILQRCSGGHGGKR